MKAIEQAIWYCLNRPTNRTRRLGIPGTNMRKAYNHPDELKRFDPKEGDEQEEAVSDSPETEEAVAEEA